MPARPLFLLAVQGLSQIQGQGAFADVGSTREEVGMRYPVLGDAIPQLRDDRIVPDYLPHSVDLPSNTLYLSDAADAIPSQLADWWRQPALVRRAMCVHVLNGREQVRGSCLSGIQLYGVGDVTKSVGLASPVFTRRRLRN